MIKRSLWLDRLQWAWARRSIVWLSGVRRVGKTTLAQMLPDAVYMNCDLPSTLRALDSADAFPPEGGGAGSQTRSKSAGFREARRACP